MSKILIVADDDSVRKELKERIEAMGHEIKEAACLNTAIKWLDKNTVDCVLLDLCFLVKFEGVGRIQHGEALLHRMMAGEGGPALIIITANDGVDVAVMEIGANSFVVQPFDEIEPKVKMALSRNTQQNTRKKFRGGVLALNKDGIELCGHIVGGIKGNAYIRRIIETLGQKTTIRGTYRRISAKELAGTIGAKISPAVIPSAIRDFRYDCCVRLGCQENDVIQTHPRGGYQLAPWIEFQLRKDRPVTQLEKDKQAVFRQVKKNGRRTRRQIYENTGIPIARLKRALSSLVEEKAIALTGSGSTTFYEISTKARRQSKHL